MNPADNRIPVTIFTGFPGAGKTTLLNRLIRDYPDKKFAIIENACGQTVIDHELVINIDKTNICELANGCICCSLNEDLADLLKDLLNSGKPFDHLLEDGDYRKVGEKRENRIVFIGKDLNYGDIQEAFENLMI